jgi:hypothetical protein
VIDPTTGDRVDGVDDIERDDDVDRDTVEKQIELEQTREELHETVEAIGDRLTPAAIAENARQTVRDATVGKVEDMTRSAERMFDDAGTTVQEVRYGIVETIRRNPIPAALAGVGIAWLATHRAPTDSYGYRSSDRRRDAWKDDDWRSGDNGSSGQGIGQRVGEVGDRMSEVGDRVGQRVSDVGETLSDRAERIGERVSDVPDQMQYRVQDLSEQARTLIQDSPLAVGAVAVAVGTALGAALPTTSTERRVLRPAAERAIDTAEQKATAALEQADQRMSEATSGQGRTGTARGRSTSSGGGSTSGSGATSGSGSTSGSGTSATGANSSSRSSGKIPSGSSGSMSGMGTGSSRAASGSAAADTSGTSANRTNQRQRNASR